MMDIWSTEAGAMGSTDRRPLLGGSIQDGGVVVHPGPSIPAPTQAEPPHQDVKLYPQRWYILVLFAMLCFMQGGVWNTWGPLSQSTERVFLWNDGTTALLSNWGPITYIISTPFFAWLMDVKGLRWASIVTGLLVAGGTGLRCITSSQPAVTWLMHLGQVLNGLGGPVAMGAAPLLSALWFPAYQRTTATAFMAIMNGIGVAVSFIIGPLLVPVRYNSTLPHNTGFSFEGNVFMGNLSEDSSYDADAETKKDIMKLMYIEFGMAGGLLLLILIYFPSKPPKPPSITASIERVDFKAGVRRLLRHGMFWILTAPYAISGGIYNCWSSVLDLNLKPLGISQDKAGWLGFYMTIAGNVAGLVIAGFADVFKRRMKLYMLILFSGALIVYAVFAVACQGYIPLTDELLYPTLILGGIFISGGSPLFYELCCETTYPIAEGVTNSLLTWLNNVAGLIFLLVMMIPHIGITWMNWCMMGSVGICIPILCLVRERYSRLDIDIE